MGLREIVSEMLETAEEELESAMFHYPWYASQVTDAEERVSVFYSIRDRFKNETGEDL